MIKLFPFAIIFWAVCFTPLVSQELQQEDTTPKLLIEQYSDLLEKSESYNEYKVIKTEALQSFQKVISDSVNAYNSDKKKFQEMISTQHASIEKLEGAISEKDQIVNEIELEKNSIQVLGIEFQKQSYGIISLIVPFVLVIIIVLLWIKYNANNIATKEAKENLISVEKDLEEYKKRALEIQMKLKRELQTERNKLLELKK